MKTKQLALTGFITLVFLLGKVGTVKADTISTSSTYPNFPATKAYDSSDTSTWCAAEISPGKTFQFGESFDDWWQVDFSQVKTIGSIYMRSGSYSSDRLAGWKTRNFAWAYQKEGSSEWIKIPEASMYANRYQLIFRFTPISNVKKMKIFIKREPLETVFTGRANEPCLREVSFYPTKDEKIETTPWIASVYLPENSHAFQQNDFRGGCLVDQIKVALGDQCDQSVKNVDVYDTFWAGEFNKSKVLGVLGSDGTSIKGSAATAHLADKKRQLVVGDKKMLVSDFKENDNYANWMMHEPAPSGMIISGSFLEWSESNPYLLAGLYNFINANYNKLAILGICGGHQYIAMQFTHSNFEEFKNEFKTELTAADREKQTVLTCINLPWIAQGVSSKDPKFIDIWKTTYPIPQRACGEYGWIKLKIERKDDPLFKGIIEPFYGRETHWDGVMWEKISSRFDRLVTYPSENQYNYADGNAETNNFTISQSIKLKNYPIYGTQFHPDFGCIAEITKNSYDLANSLQILKNFSSISFSYKPNATSSCAELTCKGISCWDNVSNKYVSGKKIAGCATVDASFNPGSIVSISDVPPNQIAYLKWIAKDASKMQVQCEGLIMTPKVDIQLSSDLWQSEAIKAGTYIKPIGAPDGYPVYYKAGTVGTQTCTFYPINKVDGQFGSPLSVRLNVGNSTVAQCGSAHKTCSTVKPIANLCASGTVNNFASYPATTVTGYAVGWWIWNCGDGNNCWVYQTATCGDNVCSSGYKYNSSNAKCEKISVETAACGSNAKNYASSVTVWPSTSETAFCAQGTADPVSPVFPDQGAKVSWKCQSSTGATVECSAKRDAKICKPDDPNCPLRTCKDRYCWNGCELVRGTSNDCD